MRRAHLRLVCITLDCAPRYRIGTLIANYRNDFQGSHPCCATSEADGRDLVNLTPKGTLGVGGETNTGEAALLRLPTDRVVQLDGDVLIGCGSRRAARASVLRS